MFLDYRLVEGYFPAAYYLAMESQSFRDRVKEQLESQAMSKAQLSRISGVPYHTIDKFLKRDNAQTGADNAKLIADALGIKADEDREYEELRSVFYRLNEEQQRFLITSAKGLLSEETS